MQEFDLVVIGGGSAGLKAARTAARLGRTVALAEERELGGECFWAGCVPTKAMVRAAQVWHLVQNSQRFGIEVDIKKADFKAAMAYKDSVVRTIGGEGPSDGGLSKLGAAYFPTRATFESPNDVRVGKEVIRGKHIIIATGTVPYIPAISGLEEVGYITNREAVSLEVLPKRLLVIGGGPIGLEFAQLFRRFGAEVTVVDHNPQILTKEDTDISEHARQFLTEEGIRFITSMRGIEVSKVKGHKHARIQVEGATHEIDCDEILVAAGRLAATEGLNIGASGVEHNARCITLDHCLRTSVPHIWGAGDIGGGYLFTHVASYEGKLAALNAFTDT